MGQTESLVASTIFFGIVGIGAAAMWVPSATLIQKWFGAKKRGLALGIIGTSSGAGFGLMGLFLPIVVVKYNWRIGWFLLGTIGLSFIFLNWLLLRDHPEDKGLLPLGGKIEDTRENNFRFERLGYFGILKQSEFWIIGISYFLISYGSYGLLDFIVTYGKMELDIPYGTASLFITIIAFSGIPGGLLMTILSDHIGTKKSLVITYGLISLSILSIIFVGSHVSLLMIGVAWFGFFYGGIFPIVAACARDYFPKRVTGTVLGLLTIFYGAGAMSTPILTGYLADTTGTFRWSFGLGAFAALVAGFVIAFIRRPRNLF